MNGDKWKDSMTCQHYFEDHHNYYGAVTPPIVQTTLFSFDTYEEYIRASERERETYVYTRGVNPTTEILEKKIALLEGGEKAKAFASGMGAISATLFSLVESGDHILFVNHVYGPASQYAEVLKKFHVESSIIHVKSAAEVESHVKENTKIIYYESPSTMLMQMLDVETIVNIAKRHNALTITDNTWSTPLLQKPLKYGVDLVVHSCTKYIGGHSDVTAGVVVGNHTLIDQISKNGYMLHGAVLGPFEAWLLIRGLRSLEARLEHQIRTTKQVIDALKMHPMVKHVNHPLCYTEEQKELAEKYLTGYSSLLSIELNTESFEEICTFANACQVFQIGVSWGGFESLILPQNRGNNGAVLEQKCIPKGLVRVYVGMEPAEVLIEDLLQALDKIRK